MDFTNIDSNLYQGMWVAFVIINEVVTVLASANSVPELVIDTNLIDIQYLIHKF